MIYLIIWILFGIGCAIAASNKNRSAAGWFFLGILLGPFGLIFILLLSPLTASASKALTPLPPDALRQVLPTSEISLGEENKKCPACAEIIKLEALKCRFCGEALDPQTVARQVEERRAALADDLEKRTAGKVKCPCCGQWDVYRATIEDGGQGHWCPNCKISLEKLAAHNLKQFFPN